MMEAKRRWKCTECGHVCADSEALSAVHPFIPGADISGCPKCGEAGSLIAACQSMGCKSEAGGGYSEAFGYRYAWLCWDHSPNNKDGEPANIEPED